MLVYPWIVSKDMVSGPLLCSGAKPDFGIILS